MILDQILVNIYKQLIDKLVAITTHIVNTSLQSRFPERWERSLSKAFNQETNTTM